LATLALGGGCMLSNISVDKCSEAADCQAAFGLGSTCDDGYCTDPAACDSGQACRKQFGAGACLAGLCQATLPAPSEVPVAVTCPAELREPADLGTLPMAGPGAPLIIGAIWAQGDPFDAAQGAAVRLAVREINNTGGLNNGRKLGLVVCDNAGPDAAASDAERTALNEAALDYLAGTLGVPAVIGPFTSRDALAVVNHMLAQRYPTLIVSPSATTPQLSAQPDKLDPSDEYGLFWRTCSSDELQGQVLANHVVPRADNMAVAYSNDPYGQGLSNVFLLNRATPPVGETTPFPFEIGADYTSLVGNIEAIAAPHPPADGVLIVSPAAADTVAILTAMSTTTLASKAIFLTDGSKDAQTLLDSSLPAAVKTMISAAQGTAPAVPTSPTYAQFKAELQATFAVNADEYGFMANSYDAGWVVAYGVVYASVAGDGYDGRNVAEGLAHLTSGVAVTVGPTSWANAKLALTTGNKEMNIDGVSGPLDFDSTTGDAPGPIAVWKVNATFDGFDIVDVFVP